MKLEAVAGAEVCLRVNGVPLLEYDDEEDEGQTHLKGVKYVEASSGSNFAVFFKADRALLGNDNRDHVECAVSLDGKWVCGKVLDVFRFPTYVTDIVGRNGLVNEQHVLQRFTFADLETNEDPPGDLKNIDFKQLGNVEVKLYFVRKLGASSPDQHPDPLKSSAYASIPEKCLKGRAISSQAALTKPEPVASAFTPVNVEYPYGRNPFGTFIFKYRSRRDLQIQGIMPRSSSPTPLEERDPNDLSPEEARELVRRMRAREEENKNMKKIKKEKRTHAPTIEENEDDEVSFTEAPARKRSRTSADSGVEIIDLSDD